MATKTKESIILWGPPSSGKTTLVKAFIRKLSLLSADDTDFFYDATNWQTNFPFDPKRLEQKALGTQFEADELIAVERKPKQKTPQHQYSCAYEYLVHIRDLEGGRAISSAQDNSILLNADNLVITVDGARFASNVSSEHKYSTDLNNLRMRLKSEKQKRGQKVNIAFCITKGDKFNMVTNPSGSMEMTQNDVLDKIRQEDRLLYLAIEQFRYESEIFHCNVFFTSSTGWYFKGGEKYDNHSEPQDDNEKWLHDTERWDPVAVTDPFFWLFNTYEEEQEKLKNKPASNLWGIRRDTIKRIPWPIFIKD